MSDRNCRTPVELDAETTRLLELLGDAARADLAKIEHALSKACDSTLMRVSRQIAKTTGSDAWPRRIQTILEQREIERARRAP
jgi:hypothetical protein